jgi:hypothetical protein
MIMQNANFQNNNNPNMMVNYGKSGEDYRQSAETMMAHGGGEPFGPG